MSRALSVFCLLCLFTATSAVYAASDESSTESNVGRWLSDAAQAVRTGSYRGVMVYLRQKQLDTLRVVHRYHDDIEQERLVALTGRPREIIRRGSRVISILPGNKVVLISHQQKRDSLLSRVGRFSTDKMRAHYHMQLLGSRRLADRPTQVVRIQPQDKYRYGYRILIDKKTYLPLKLNLIYDDHVLEQLMFTEITYPEQIPDSAFNATYDIDDYKVVNQKEAQVSSSPVAKSHWRTTHLPPGFELVETGVRNTPGGPSVQQMLFTDGVATASAFIGPAEVANPLIGGTTMGAVNAFGRAVGAFHITVVGEVPAVTVRMIAQNLVHEGSTTADADK